MPFVETYRSAVAPADCDVLGHMNVSKYFGACGDGVLAFQTRLGLGISDLRDGRRLSFAVVHAESDFRFEILAGAVIYLETAIGEIATKSIVLRHRLRRAEHDALAFEARFRCVLLSLESRRAVAIPDDVRQKAEAYLIPPPEA